MLDTSSEQWLAAKAIRAEPEAPVDVVRLSDLDVSDTQALIEQQIALERRRNFRSLCWMGTAVLLLVLVVAALLLSVSAVVLGNSREAIASVRQVSEDSGRELEKYGREMSAVALDVKNVGEKTQVISDAMRGDQEKYDKDRDQLREDLLRFSLWYDGRYSSMNAAMASVKDSADRMAAADAEEQRRRRRFELIERWYQERQALGSALATIPATSVPSDTRPLTTPPLDGPAVASDLEVSVDLDRRNQRPVQRGPVAEIRYPSGDRYEGGVRGDKRHGQGALAYANGDKYIGEFENDVSSGRGTYIYKSGARYEGDFWNGCRHGEGTYRYANGDSFKGTFVNDKKHGAGIYTYADGTPITGTWQHDRLAASD